MRARFGLALLCATGVAPAQETPGSVPFHVILGFGVDTSVSPVRDIFRTWMSFVG